MILANLTNKNGMNMLDHHMVNDSLLLNFFVRKGTLQNPYGLNRDSELTTVFPNQGTHE